MQLVTETCIVISESIPPPNTTLGVRTQIIANSRRETQEKKKHQVYCEKENYLLIPATSSSPSLTRCFSTIHTVFYNQTSTYLGLDTFRKYTTTD